MRKVALAALLLLVATACDWPQVGYGPDHTGSSPDTSIGVAAITSNSLTVRWRTDTSTTSYGPAGAVAGDIAFASRASDGISAFDAAGSTNCSGVPVVCSPLWTATTTPPTPLSGPAVAAGVMIAANGGGLVAFDATGVTNCSGAPKSCAPMWSSDPLIGGTTGPVVAGNRAFQGFRTSQQLPFVSGVAVYDLAGVQNCSGAPVVCTPLWTDLTPDLSYPVGPPSVSNGVAYLVSGSRLYAFDAAGTAGCSGTPKTCTPMWSAAIVGGARPGPPVVANGKVFVSSAGLAQTVAFDAAGNARCGGSPKTCLPVWIAKTTSGPPSIAGGKVFLTNGGKLAVYAATGQTGCTGGALRTCSPLWSYTAHPFQCNPPGPCDSFSAYSIANNVVYQGYSNPGAGDVTAYDATGTIGCSGTPKVCTPLRSWPTGVAAAPIISNGSLYVSWSATPGFSESGFQVLR